MGEENLTLLGYRVTTRSSGPDALEVFRNSPDHFDLVITDMTMPCMTGDLLTEALREIRPDIPVILCTGFADSKTKSAFEKSGICELLRKPLTRSDLARTIRKILDLEEKDSTIPTVK